jgi:hypothetical protein
VLNPLVQALVYPITRSQGECAELMWFALLNGEKGAFRRDKRGDDIGGKMCFGSEEDWRKVWDHTVEVTRSGDVEQRRAISESPLP